MLKTTKIIPPTPRSSQPNQENPVTLVENVPGRQITTVQSFRDLPTTATEMSVPIRATGPPPSPIPVAPLLTTTTSPRRITIRSRRPTSAIDNNNEQPLTIRLPTGQTRTSTELDPPLVSAFRMVGNILQSVDGHYGGSTRVDQQLQPSTASTSALPRRPDIRAFLDLLEDASVLNSNVIVGSPEPPSSTSTAVIRRNPGTISVAVRNPRSPSPGSEDGAHGSIATPATTMADSVFGANMANVTNVFMHDIFTDNPIGVFNFAINGNGRRLQWSAHDNQTINGIVRRYRSREELRSERRHFSRQVPQLSTFKLNESEGKSAWEAASKQECQICLCDFKLQEEVCFLPCAHLFHANCVREWLKRQSTCPVCRTISDE